MKFIVNSALLILSGASLAYGLNVPASFNGTAVSTASIVWSWEDNSNDENGYRILDDQGIQIGTDLPSGATSFHETGLNSNTSHKRKVQSFNGSSALVSGQLTVYSHTPPPTNLGYTTRSTTAITISWESQDSIKLATRYGLERGTSASGPFSVLLGASSGYSSTIFTNGGLAPKTTYYFRVFALNGDNVASAYSSTAALRTRAAVPNGISSLAGTSVQDRIVRLSWTAIADPIASSIRVVRTDYSGVSISSFLPVSQTEYFDRAFNISESTFSQVRYSATTLNEDGDAGRVGEISVAPLVLYQYADTDGDGSLEIWDVANTTYSDVSKPAGTANRLIQTLMISTTRVLLIDVYRRSAVPAAADFDSFPDVVWAPNLNLVNQPIISDFDGDGLSELGLDLTGDGLADGSLNHGVYKAFGTLNVLVRDQIGLPVRGAKVNVKFNGFASLNVTNSNGSALFPVYPVQGAAVFLQITSEGKLPLTERANIDVYGSNTITLQMADGDLGGSEAAVQLYPNPITAGGDINLIYQIKTPGLVQIDCYDMYRRLMKRLLSEHREAGQYSIKFPAVDDRGEQFQKGLYFCVLRAGSSKIVSKLVIK